MNKIWVEKHGVIKQINASKKTVFLDCGDKSLHVMQLNDPALRSEPQVGKTVKFMAQEDRPSRASQQIKSA